MLVLLDIKLYSRNIAQQLVTVRKTFTKIPGL